MDDASEMIDRLDILAVNYLVYISYFNSISTNDMMKKILDKIKVNWENLESPEELRIFQNYARKGQRLIIIYSALILLTVNIFITAPLLPKLLDFYIPLNESRPLRNIIYAQYYVDPEKYYWPIYFHLVQAVIIAILVVVAIDSYFLMIIQHVCGMFVVLGHKVGKIRHANSNTLNFHSDSERDIVISGRIVNCLRYHCLCIRFSEMIESSFTISFLFQLFMNIFLIIINGVQITARTNRLEGMLTLGLKTVSTITRLFYISWAGQTLLDHSEKVHEYLSNVTWYEFPPKATKMILIMLIKSKNPNYITVGKIITLNLNTYSRFIKFSGSLFTLILTTQ